MIFLVIVSLVWSLSFAIIKGSLTGIDPAFVALCRLSLCVAAFLPLFKPRAFRPRELATLVCTGGVQFGLMYVLYIEAFKYLPAHMIVFLTTTTPLFVSLLDNAMSRKVAWGSICAAALAVVAGAVIKYPDQRFSASVFGVVLMQISNLAFASGQVVYRRIAAGRPAWNDSAAMSIMYVGGAATALIFEAARGWPVPSTLSPGQVGALLYLGLVASALCFYLWNRGARAVSAGTLAIMNNAKIPLGIVASMVILREQTDITRLATGVGVMALALWLNSRTQPMRNSQ